MALRLDPALEEAAVRALYGQDHLDRGVRGDRCARLGDGGGGGEAEGGRGDESAANGSQVHGVPSGFGAARRSNRGRPSARCTRDSGAHTAVRDHGLRAADHDRGSGTAAHRWSDSRLRAAHGLQVSAGFPPASPSRARILLSPRRTGALACYGRRGGSAGKRAHCRPRRTPGDTVRLPAQPPTRRPDRARVAGTPSGGRDEPPRLPGEMTRSGFPVPGKQAGRPFPAQPPARTPGARTIPGPSLRSGDCRAYIGIFAHTQKGPARGPYGYEYIWREPFCQTGKATNCGTSRNSSTGSTPGSTPCAAWPPRAWSGR